MAYKFLHTADWQMGMMAVGLGHAAQAVRAARLDALKNLLALAPQQGARAILAAGDLFENNQVSDSLVEQVADILNTQTNIPLYIIPGNHDPLSRDSVYNRPVWSRLKPHVHVLRDSKPIVIDEPANVVLYPCPLSRKNGTENPTHVIPAREASDQRLRIGLAHGTMRIMPNVGDDDFPIPLDSATRLGLDYLALGHWHSTLASQDKRSWYSGTHETTKFGERDSGNALLVTLDSPGELPDVQTVRTGRLMWREESFDVDAGLLTDLDKRLRDDPAAPTSIVRITLTGHMKPEEEQLVDQLGTLAQTRYLFAQIDAEGLIPADFHERFKEMLVSPHLKAAVEALGQASQGNMELLNKPHQSDPNVNPATARRALELLRQAAWTEGKP